MWSRAGSSCISQDWARNPWRSCNSSEEQPEKSKFRHQKLSQHLQVGLCPGGGKRNDGIFLSTLNYSAIIAINETLAMTATVQSGIGLRTFLDAVAAQNLALPIAHYWDGITLGSLLGTGGHASTLFGRGSALHDYVTSLKIVITATAAEGYSKTITLITAECDPADLNAAKLFSLAVLGVFPHCQLRWFSSVRTFCNI